MKITKAIIPVTVAVAAVGLIIYGLTHKPDGTPVTPGGGAAPAFFDKAQIKVLGHKKGPGGLDVWQVERAGAKTVFYTTSDGKALISGVLWDARTGENLSDAFITADMAQPGASAQQQAVATPPKLDMKQYSPDKIPDAIKGIATLAGIKEGKADIDKTLYIVFDPRCVHCHNVYRNTRDFVAAGGSIKWIPAVVISNPYDGMALSAEVLESPSPAKALASIMETKRNSYYKPSAQSAKVLAENEAYLYAAFNRNPSAGETGVPVAFFVDKNGVPQMIGGIDDPVLLPQILTGIKK